MILFKTFRSKLAAYVNTSRKRNESHFGVLRKAAIDEIELEPIEHSIEQKDDVFNGQDGDPLDLTANMALPRAAGFGNQRAQLLSEICELTDEESSIQDFQNPSSIPGVEMNQKFDTNDCY